MRTSSSGETHSGRSATLQAIRIVLDHEGMEPAVRATRAAFEAGLLHALDIPEVFFALRAGSAAFLDTLAGRDPGRFQFHRARA